MAISYLQDAYGDDFYNLDLPFLRDLESERLAVISDMITKGINSPLTSRLGRLFDGVAAICGIRSRVNFEGQAAMELEMLAGQMKVDNYSVISAHKLAPPGPGYFIDTSGIGLIPPHSYWICWQENNYHESVSCYKSSGCS